MTYRSSRNFSTILTSLLALVVLIGLLTGKLGDIRGKNKVKYQQHVGKQLVIDGDTLTITDYSVMEESFYLSNGSKVNFYYVVNRQIEQNQ